MEPRREAQELLEVCREEQELLAELYESYRGLFPQSEELWRRLAEGERREAALVQSVQEALARGAFSYVPGSLHVSGLRANLASLSRKTQTQWKSPASLDQALEVAIKIEKSQLSRTLFDSFSSDDPELTSLVRRLGAPSEHYQQLRQTALRRTVYVGLVERGLLSAADLERARAQARSEHAPISRLLTSHFGVPKAELLRHLREYFGVPSFQAEVDPPPSRALTQEFSPLAQGFRRDGFVPVAELEGALCVAVEDPKDAHQRDLVARAFEQRRVQLHVATLDDILATVDAYYTRRQAPHGSLKEVIDELDESYTDEDDDDALERAAQSLVGSEDTAVVRLVNRLVEDAVKRGASDIHIEPSTRDSVQIRLRIDGELTKTVTIPRQLRRVVIARLKIMAGLDIAERRKPQSGKITFRDWGKLDVELRLEIYLTVSGEDAVLRILAENRVRPLEELRLLPATEACLKELLECPYGLLLCVGPTGSGKTTTLHSALAHLQHGDRKILTVEDPVEITQEGLRQVQVNTKAGLNFALALRSFLRSDPDIIMVGEMRDLETASIAVAASLTGHLVLSTLHTNNAPETVTRLIDMGLDRFSFADSLIGVLAQRLVRGLCERCSTAAKACELSEATLAEDYEDQEAFAGLLAAHRGRQRSAGEGCSACSGRGFRGRLGIHELMSINDDLRRAVCAQASARELRELAVASGMRTLRQDGIEKVLAGWTTPEEVRAATSR